MDRKLIDQYADGGDKLTEAIAGLSEEQMAAFPVPGTLSIQQIVLQLLDSDLIGAERMKRVTAEDDPLLVAFDETAFSKKLFYDQLDARLAAEVFAKNRSLMSEILRRLSDEAFARTGRHSERGPVSLADLLATFVGHLEHHLKFIQQKRRLVE